MPSAWDSTRPKCKSEQNLQQKWITLTDFKQLTITKSQTKKKEKKQNKRRKRKAKNKRRTKSKKNKRKRKTRRTGIKATL